MINLEVYFIIIKFFICLIFYITRLDKIVNYLRIKILQMCFNVVKDMIKRVDFIGILVFVYFYDY